MQQRHMCLAMMMVTISSTIQLKASDEQLGGSRIDQPVMANGNESGLGPDPLFRTTLKGDFVASSKTLIRANPYWLDEELIVEGIPEDATVRAALLNWSHLTDNPNSETISSLSF